MEPMTEETKNPRPPADRGQGRKALPHGEKKKPRSLSLKPSDWERFDAIGGQKWFESAVARAYAALVRKSRP